jgi:hypothetical protein
MPGGKTQKKKEEKKKDDGPKRDEPEMREVPEKKGESADDAAKRVKEAAEDKGLVEGKDFVLTDDVDNQGKPKKKDGKDDGMKEQLQKDKKEADEENPFTANKMAEGNTVPGKTLTPEQMDPVNFPDMKAKAKDAEVSQPMALDVKSLPFIIKSKVESSLKYRMSKINRLTLFEYGSKIKDFSDAKTYLKARSDLILETVAKYDGMLVDMPRALEPRFEVVKTVAPDAIGFDVWRLLDEVLPSQYSQLAGMLRDPALSIQDAPAGIPDAAAKEYVPLLVTDDEFILIQTMQSIWNEQLMEYGDAVNWFRNLDGRLTYLGPVDVSSNDVRFTKFKRPEPSDAFYHVIRNNTFCWPLMHDIFTGMSKGLVQIPFSSESNTFFNLLKQMRISTTSFSPIQAYAGSINSADGRFFIEQLLAIDMGNEWTRLSYTPNFDSLSLSVLMDAITFKLCTPGRLWRPESVLDIENYIALYIIPVLPGYDERIGGAIWSLDAARRRTTNMLTAMYNAGPALFASGNAGLAGQVWAAVWGFLGPSVQWMGNYYIPIGGQGWVTGGATNVAPVPPNSALFRPGGQPYLFEYWGGSAVEDTEVDLTQQFLRFTEFKRVIAGEGFPDSVGRARLNRDVYLAFQRLMQLMGQHGTRHSQMCKAIDNSRARLNLTSILGQVPTAGAARSSDPRQHLVEVKSGSALSMFLNADWQLVEPVELNTQIITKAWDIHDQFNLLVENWFWIRSHFPKPWWTKRERVEMLAAMTPGLGTFMNKFKEVLIGNASYMEILNMPQVAVTPMIFTRKWQAAMEFIGKNTASHGFVRSFDFVTNAVQGPAPAAPYRRLFLADSDYTSTIDRDGMEDTIAQQGAKGYFDNLILNGSHLRLDFPIMVEATEAETRIVESDPFEINQAKHMKTGKINVWWMYIDENRVDLSNLGALERLVRWRVHQNPFLNTALDDVPRLRQTILVWKKGFRLFSPTDIPVFPHGE